MLSSSLLFLAGTAAREGVPLTVREGLSGAFGSVSLACWIFLLAPQLVENYRNQSAEAISLAFIFVWFLGDVCNLVGALWAGLVPVIIAIAVYFCIADGVLIGQCMYYSIRNKRREGRTLLAAARASVVVDDDHRITPSLRSPEATREESDEEEPLLKRTRTNSITIPGSAERRRSSGSARRRASSGAGGHLTHDHLAQILEESDEHGVRLWFKNVISVIAIIAVGCVGWGIAYATGAWQPTPTAGDLEEEQMAAGAQILGYLSAVAYLGARIPQIIKNARDKSCEGLSLLFFILSLLGNLSYGAGILFHSTESQYVMKNLPWLIGSLGTMAEDITIFIQFHIYKDADLSESAVV